MSEEKLAEQKKIAWQHFQNKNYRNAAKNYINIIRSHPTNPSFINMLGLSFNMMGKPLWAIKTLEKATQYAPNDASLFNNIGALYMSRKQLDSALQAFENAWAINPNIKGPGYNIAKIYFYKKKFEKALVRTNQVLEIEKNNAKLMLLKGYIFAAMEEYQQAYDILIDYLPEHKKDDYFLHYLGVSAFNIDKFDEAIHYFTSCIKLNPKKSDYWNVLGIALKKLKNRSFLREVKCFRNALKLSPKNIYYLHNMANTLINADKLFIAEKILHQVLDKSPEFSEALISYGYLNQLLNKTELAKSYYRKAMELQGDINATTNLGLLLLTEGNFKEGWETYEKRWLHPDLKTIRANFSDTLWQGEPLDEQRLMIFTEQGFGDTINFVRYIPLINKGTGKIFIECRPPIIDLIQTVENIDLVSSRDEPFPEHDFYIPLLSLPRLFGTDESNIPNQVPYLFVDEQKNKHWENYFNRFGDSFNIGIAWAGSPGHKHDHYRTIKAELFKQLKIHDNINLFSLQLDAKHARCDRLGFISLSENIKDFTDTAAIINNLDLVISVDTAVVHLAGALNKPVWTIIGFYCDWRWMFERTDSPWYPSMKLFRQQKRGYWQQVFDDLKIALDKVVMHD